LDDEMQGKRILGMYTSRNNTSFQNLVAIYNMEDHEHYLLFHYFLDNLYWRCNVVRLHRSTLFDYRRLSSHIESLKDVAYVLELTLSYVGGSCLESRFLPFDWALGVFESETARSEFLESKWTSALRKKIHGYSQAIFRIIKIWRVREQITNLASFRLFLKSARLLQFLVVKTLKLECNPRRWHEVHMTSCGCRHCELSLTY